MGSCWAKAAEKPQAAPLAAAAPVSSLTSFRHHSKWEERRTYFLNRIKGNVPPFPAYLKTKQDQDEWSVLVSALQMGAQLEHGLLNAYIVAYTSIKSLPEEYATNSVGGENPRRAVQFELGRQIREKITSVATQEMLHLHYVNLILFNLNAGPAFMLPPPMPGGGWQFDAWKVPSPNGGTQVVQVPLTSMTLQQILNMVRYESSSEMLDPSHKERLFQVFEDLRKDNLLKRLSNLKAPLGENFDALVKLYNGTPINDVSHLPHPFLRQTADGHDKQDPPGPITNFETIQEFYGLIKQLLLYGDSQGWLETYRTVTGGPPENHGLMQEVQGPDFYHGNLTRLWPNDFPAESETDINANPPAMHFRDRAGTHLVTHYGGAGTLFVPRPPYNTRRPKKEGTSNPSEWYVKIADIFDQIVEQGEAFSQWMEWTEAVIAGKAKPDDEARLRGAHVTMFADVYQTLIHERAVGDPKFDFCRVRVDPAKTFSDQTLITMIQMMPKMFNAAYLVAITMLSRMYQNAESWVFKKDPSRMAVESVGSWPVMSQALRPLMDAMSFWLGMTDNLYVLTLDALPPDSPDCPVKNLLAYFQNLPPNDNPKSTDPTTGYKWAAQVLTSVGLWCEDARKFCMKSDPLKSYLGGVAARIMVASFDAASVMKIMNTDFEFRSFNGSVAQYPPPTSGDRKVPGVEDYYKRQARPLPTGMPPSLFYDQIFEEDPTMLGTVIPDTPLYENTFLLEMKFVGNIRIQFANDPDTPQDCVGTRGILKVRSEDFPPGTEGKFQSQFFNRSILLQQPGDGVVDSDNVIMRGPDVGGTSVGATPSIGTYVSEISIKAASRSIAPPNDPNSPNLQDNFLSLAGVANLATKKAGDFSFSKTQFKVDWERRQDDDRRTCFQGYNQVLCNPVETLDPETLSIYVNDKGDVIQRSIYNGAKPGEDGPFIMDYNSLQRGCLMRGPSGNMYPPANLDPKSYPSNYSWALKPDVYPAPWNNYVGKYPDMQTTFQQYNTDRCNAIANCMNKAIDQGLNVTRWQNDQLVSWAERFLFIYNQTMQPKIQILLHDCMLHAQLFHTLSGNMKTPSDPSTDGVLGVLKSMGYDASYTKSDTYGDISQKWQPNNRWTVDYGMGMLDTDTISGVLIGSLTIPITINSAPNTFEQYFNRGVPGNLWTNPSWCTVIKISDKERTIQFSVPFGNTTKTLTFDEQLTEYDPNQFPAVMKWITMIPGGNWCDNYLTTNVHVQTAHWIATPTGGMVRSGVPAAFDYLLSLDTWWNRIGERK